jgi:hypothetical protein
MRLFVIRIMVLVALLASMVLLRRGRGRDPCRPNECIRSGDSRFSQGALIVSEGKYLRCRDGKWEADAERSADQTSAPNVGSENLRARLPSDASSRHVQR